MICGYCHYGPKNKWIYCDYYIDCNGHKETIPDQWKKPIFVSLSRNEELDKPYNGSVIRGNELKLSVTFCNKYKGSI
jgi:hypothetical protein